jgi:hypothetical protein
MNVGLAKRLLAWRERMQAEDEATVGRVHAQTRREPCARLDRWKRSEEATQRATRATQLP